MNIEWLIPCRFAEVHDNLGTIIGAGIDTFWVPQVPAVVQLMAAMRVTGMTDELQPEIEHTLVGVIKDPAGNTMSKLDGTIAFGQDGPVMHEDWLQGVTLSTIVQFEAAQFGTYTFEQAIDGSTSSFPMHVVQGPPPGALPPES